MGLKSKTEVAAEWLEVEREGGEKVRNAENRAPMALAPPTPPPMLTSSPLGGLQLRGEKELALGGILTVVAGPVSAASQETQE